MSNILTVDNDGGIIVEHIASNSTGISMTATAALGSTGSISLINASDMAGYIAMEPGGTGITTGTLVNITFGKAYNNTPVVLLSAASPSAHDVMRDQQSDGLYFDYSTVSTTGFSIATGKTWNAGTSIVLSYIVIGN